MIRALGEIPAPISTAKRMKQQHVQSPDASALAAAAGGWSPLFAFVALPLMVVAGAGAVLLSARRVRSRRQAVKATVAPKVPSGPATLPSVSDVV